METQIHDGASQENSQQSNLPSSQKYGIFQSLQEMLGAVRGNPVTFIVALVVSYVAAGVALTLTFLAMASLLLGHFGLLFASFAKIITVLVVGLGIYTLLYALVYAFTVSSMAFSLEGTRNGPKSVLKRALLITPRIVKVNAWVAIIAYWPIAVAVFLPLLFLSGSRPGDASLALLTLLLVIGAVIWAIIAHLRYALAPYVALFETDVPVKQTLQRSQELLKNGGQWFIFKGFLLLLGVFILLAIITKSNVNQLENTDSLAINIILVVLSILIEGAMVMLYFNRSHKHDSSTAPKSPGLLAVVIVVLIGLFGFAAWQGQSSKTGGSFSSADQQAFLKSVNDTKRKIDMKSLANTLEDYYNKQGYYPSVSDITSTDWVAKNLTQSGGTPGSLQNTFLTDPNGKYINSDEADYQYKASPENCTKCASFELTAKLEAGGEFKQSSLNNTVKP